MTVGGCDVPERGLRERRATDADEPAAADVRRAPVTAGPIVGAGAVEGDDASVVRAPPPELTVERP